MAATQIHKSILALLFVAILGLCGKSFGEETPETWKAVKLEPGTWVVMGSSTAAGAGASAGKSWVDLLESELLDHGTRFVNIAKGGTVTYQGMSAAGATVPGRPLPDPAINIDKALSLDPALVILAYPSNDTALGYAVEETIDNLLAMRSLALANSVPVIVLSTQPRRLSDEKLARLLLIDERLLARVGPCFVETHSALAGPDGRVAPGYDAGDGVHLNNAGHQMIASRIREVLESGRCVELPATGKTHPSSHPDPDTRSR